jgi:tetratricopeptide (TPR) repeat protein
MPEFMGYPLLDWLPCASCKRRRDGPVAAKILHGGAVHKTAPEQRWEEQAEARKARRDAAAEREQEARVSAYYHFASSGKREKNKWDSFDVEEELNLLEESKQESKQESKPKPAEASRPVKTLLSDPEVGVQELLAKASELSLMDKKQFDKEHELYERALELEPANWLVHSSKAKALQREGKFLQAFGQCRRGLEKCPDSKELAELMEATQYQYKALGSAFNKTQNQGLPAYDPLAKLKPDSAKK